MKYLSMMFMAAWVAAGAAGPQTPADVAGTLASAESSAPSGPAKLAPGAVASALRQGGAT